MTRNTSTARMTTRINITIKFRNPPENTTDAARHEVAAGGKEGGQR